MARNVYIVSGELF